MYSTDLTVIGATFTSCSAGYSTSYGGGSLYLIDSTGTVRDAKFSSSSASFRGGGGEV